MLRPPANRLILMLAAVALSGGAGAVATANPGGEPPALAPTSELAPNGGVEAPPADTDGGVEAPGSPSARLEPAPVPAPETEDDPPPARARTAQAQDQEKEDDKTVIPVPPEDLPGRDDPDDEGDRGQHGQPDEDPAPGGAGARRYLPTASDELALTGKRLAGPLAAGLLLLLAGLGLRVATAPSASSTPRA